jgi:hypothetical protein
LKADVLNYSLGWMAAEATTFSVSPYSLFRWFCIFVGSKYQWFIRATETNTAHDIGHYMAVHGRGHILIAQLSQYMLQPVIHI